MLPAWLLQNTNQLRKENLTLLDLASKINRMTNMHYKSDTLGICLLSGIAQNLANSKKVEESTPQPLLGLSIIAEFPISKLDDPILTVFAYTWTVMIT